MSIFNNFKDYKDEIELAHKQNACVEMELYSIIACIIREGINGSKISLRDVSRRRITEISHRFYGSSGFPDFVVLERKNEENAKILGCIEAKMPRIKLDEDSNQIKGHIESFKKVLYTNGLVWRFYNNINKEEEWTCTLGSYDNCKIVWIEDGACWNNLLKNLDNIKWSL